MRRIDYLGLGLSEVNAVKVWGVNSVLGIKPPEVPASLASATAGGDNPPISATTIFGDSHKVMPTNLNIVSRTDFTCLHSYCVPYDFSYA